MATIKISRMEAVTLGAMDSPNPFHTPTPPPMTADGKIIPSVPVNAPKQPPAPSEPKPEAKPPVDEVLSKIPDIKSSDIVEDIKEDTIIESRSQEGMPSYRCEFSGRDIFMAWPWYRSTNPVTAAVCFSLGQDFGRDKLRQDMSVGDSEHGKNRLINKFLQTDAKWLWFIDSDIIPCIGRPHWMRSWVYSAQNIGDVPLQRHILHRLIGSGKTLVGGAYFGRQEKSFLMCSNQSLAERAKEYEDAIVEVDWVGSGCMLVHRKVFQSIREKYGDSLKVNSPNYDYDYFRPFDSVGGGDAAFCKRAKESGHNANIDLGTPVFHVGYKTY